MDINEVLKRSQLEKNDEINEYIDNKTTQYSSIIFVISCILMMILSFQSSKQAEIFYTSATLFSTFLCIYGWTRYYYIRNKWSFILGLMFFIVTCFTIAKVWMIIW